RAVVVPEAAEDGLRLAHDGRLEAGVVHQRAARALDGAAGGGLERAVRGDRALDGAADGGLERAVHGNVEVVAEEAKVLGDGEELARDDAAVARPHVEDTLV